MTDSISAALSGIQAAQNQILKSSQSIVKNAPEYSEKQMITDIVDLKSAETSFKANVAVLEKEEERMGMLLDLSG